MDFLYYLGLLFLLLQVAFSVFVLVVSPLQLTKLKSKESKIRGAYRSIALQMLQALVVLALVGIIYYWLFRSELVPIWIGVLASGTLMTLDSLLRRYQASRLPL